MSKEQFTTEYDPAMRAAVLSIPEQLYRGARDTCDAGFLVELEVDNTSSAFPYSQGPSLQIQGSSGIQLRMDSIVHSRNPGSREMGLSANITESKLMKTPPGLWSPEILQAAEKRGLTDTDLLDELGLIIRQELTYGATINSGRLTRNPSTIVTIGNSTTVFSPNGSLINPQCAIPGMNPAKLFSVEGLAGLPVPSEEELGVERFNRIITGLGFGALQVRTY